MIFEIYQQTDEGIRGWFPMSLPFARRVLEDLDISEYPEMKPDVTGQLTELAQRARVHSNLMASSGEYIAAAVIQSVFRFVVGRIRSGGGRAIERYLQHLNESQGTQSVDAAKVHFLRQFPAPKALQSDLRFVAESLLILVARDNPAMRPLHQLFGRDLREEVSTRSFFEAVQTAELWIDEGPLSGDGELNLYQMLMRPILEHPEDLQRQVQVILTQWRDTLPSHLVEALLRSLDILNEERTDRGFGGVPGAPPPLRFSSKDWVAESKAIAEARFTPDRDWMSNVVIMAKQTYVWLEQLGKTYNRPVHTLDQIPNEELDRLAALGFTGLWLIGLWERSTASREIKVRMGNPDAAASAYSLYDYAIAQDLGGDSAYENLSKRAWERGIRLAADMVPNHVGIDGKWVVEHPDSFVQTRTLPYPNYRFDGPNLSSDDRVSIYLEDGYYSKSDAAVVFKRVDNQTQDVRYIYHGNDGTQMPWNDTAQLDYLSPYVREQVIEMILGVARKFPIIRFDAAMTLAKKHIQRLWYPKPGDGGAIPSRAQFGGLSDEDFHQRIPKEFWREVVDRINDELPDTLLLAEAFWLMEGYFVRTLGMHRVYNSAFMNMLKREDNAGYRTTMKNTLEFSPEILKRFVNFMNNPDEETAVAQFGKGDKYLGNAILMVTMPGLPMFGHGQIEGFEEKYGMEYRRAYRDETPDPHLKWMHERFIAPLTHRRYLFSETENFQLYDFIGTDGMVNENVFAFTNRVGDERVLVLYNNSYSSASGRLGLSVRKNLGTADDPSLSQTTAIDALNLRHGPQYYLCEDFMTQQQFIRTGSEFDHGGICYDLSGYQSAIFMNFEALHQDTGLIESVRAEIGSSGRIDVKDRLVLASLGDARDQWQTFLNQLDGGIWNAEVLSTLRTHASFGHLFVDASSEVRINAHFERFAEERLNASEMASKEPSETDSVEERLDGADTVEKNESATPSIAGSAAFGAALLTAEGRRLLASDFVRHLDASFTVDHLDIWAQVISHCEGHWGVELFEAEWVQSRLNVHTYESVRWFSKDAFERFLDGVITCVPTQFDLGDVDPSALKSLADSSQYKFDDFIFLLRKRSGAEEKPRLDQSARRTEKEIGTASDDLLEGNDDSEA